MCIHTHEFMGDTETQKRERDQIIQFVLTVDALMDERILCVYNVYATTHRTTKLTESGGISIA